SEIVGPSRRPGRAVQHVLIAVNERYAPEIGFAVHGSPGTATKGRSYSTAFPYRLRAIKLWRRLPFPIAASLRIGRLARGLDQLRPRLDRRQHDVAPGRLERLDEALEGGDAQVLVGHHGNGAPGAVVGGEEVDAVERPLHQERGQRREQAHAEARMHQPQRDL